MSVPAGDGHDDPGRGVAFWPALLVGWATILFGVRGLLDDVHGADLRSAIRFFAGAGVAHDAVLAPVVVAVGWMTSKLVPASARVAVRVALGLSLVVALLSWPLVRGYGRSPSLPSALPLDYGRNLVLVLVAIWVVTAAVAAGGAVRRGRASAADQAAEPAPGAGLDREGGEPA